MSDDAQVTAPEDTEGSAPSNDASDASPSSSAPVDRQALLDRLTAAGRDRVADQQKVKYLEGQLGYVGNVVQSQAAELQGIKNAMSRQQWQDFESRLANMSPVDAANERARVAMEYSKSLEQRLTAAQQPPPNRQPQQRQETDEEYSARIANEKLAKANARHRLTGDDALTLRDMPTDAWDDPDTFSEVAGIMAKERASKREEVKSASPDKIQEMVAKEVARITGANRGMSPSPSPGEPEPASEDVARMAAQHVTNRKGPGASLAELRKHRDQVAAKIAQ